MTHTQECFCQKGQKQHGSLGMAAQNTRPWRNSQPSAKVCLLCFLSDLSVCVFFFFPLLACMNVLSVVMSDLVHHKTFLLQHLPLNLPFESKHNPFTSLNQTNQTDSFSIQLRECSFTLCEPVVWFLYYVNVIVCLFVNVQTQLHPKQNIDKRRCTIGHTVFFCWFIHENIRIVQSCLSENDNVTKHIRLVK